MNFCLSPIIERCSDFFFFKFLRWLLLSDHNTYKRQLLPILCLWSPFFICWQMNWNRNFFDNRYLNMYWNMLHNWNMFIHWNSLDVMMMYVMGMHIIWNMNDNMLTKNQLKNNNWREENKRNKKKRKIQLRFDKQIWFDWIIINDLPFLYTFMDIN